MKHRTGFVSLALVLGLSLALIGCSSQPREQVQYTEPQQNIVVNAPTASAAEGLDLQAVGGLVQQVVNQRKTAEDLERMLNQPGGINNLDLNGDGQVDYINVTEFQKDGARGFSLTVDLGGNQVQEVASIVLEKSAVPNQVQMQVAGNQQIYGPNQYYGSTLTFTDMLVLNWMFSPRPLYVSQYHYGYYPRYYGGYARVPTSTYRTNTQTVTRTTTVTRSSTPVVKSTLTSPNANKSASTIKAPLSAPTQSQRSFTQREASKPVASGGFTPSRSTSAPTQPARSTTSASRPAPAAPASRPSAPASRPSPSPSRSSSSSSSSSRRKR